MIVVLHMSKGDPVPAVMVTADTVELGKAWCAAFSKAYGEEGECDWVDYGGYEVMSNDDWGYLVVDVAHIKSPRDLEYLRIP